MSYTYAILDITPEAYQEIRELLVDARYEHAFHKDSDREVIDMHGIAVRSRSDEPELKWPVDSRCPVCKKYDQVDIEDLVGRTGPFGWVHRKCRPQLDKAIQEQK